MYPGAASLSAHLPRAAGFSRTSFVQMPDITHRQGDAGQSPEGVEPHTCQNGWCQKDRSNRCWRGCAEKPLCAFGRNVNGCGHWKPVWSFLRKLNTISSGDFTGYLPKANENSTLKREVHPCVHCSVVCSSVLLLHVASVGRGCLCRWRSPQSEPYPRRATSVSVGCQACEGGKMDDLGE